MGCERIEGGFEMTDDLMGLIIGLGIIVSIYVLVLLLENEENSK